VNVGFVLYWQRGDAARMVTRLAGRLHALGHDVFIYGRDKPQPVDAFWDRYVTGPPHRYTTWLRKHQPAYVVFGEPPAPEEVQQAMAAKATTYLLCLVTDLAEDNLGALGLLHRIICPSRYAQRLLGKLFALENAYYLPWDPGVPITRDARLVDPARVGIYWPAASGSALRQGPEVAREVWLALAERASAYLTVGYSAAMPAATTRELRKLAAGAGGRFELVKDPAPDKEQLLFGRHDVTAWPTVAEGAGLAGLTSVYMGTPVVAFDHPVVAETVKDGRSGVLVPCELGYNSLGVPTAVPDYAAFGAALAELVAHPDYLDGLRGGTGEGLARRRENFLAAVDDLFS
jgi:hypothetical protein